MTKQVFSNTIFKTYPPPLKNLTNARSFAVFCLNFMQPFVSRFQALKALLITVIAYEEDTEKKTKETTT